MHSLCLVVGKDVDRELAPFAEYLPVERYRRWLAPDEVRRMATHYGVDGSDLGVLAARLPEWSESEGGVEEGRLYEWSTENPDGKFDWYEVGGRFDGYLELRVPVPRGLVGRLLGRGPRTRTNAARKCDVRHEPLLADPPAIILHGGIWSECPLVFDDDARVREEWTRRFAEVFGGVPEEGWLTVVDLHS